MGGKNKKKVRNGGASATDASDHDAVSPATSPGPASRESESLRATGGGDNTIKSAESDLTAQSTSVKAKPVVEDKMGNDLKESNGTSKKGQPQKQNVQINGAKVKVEEEAEEENSKDVFIEHVRQKFRICTFLSRGNMHLMIHMRCYRCMGPIASAEIKSLTKLEEKMRFQTKHFPEYERLCSLGTVNLPTLGHITAGLQGSLSVAKFTS